MSFPKVKIINLYCYYLFPIILFFTFLLLQFNNSVLAYDFAVIMGQVAWWLLVLILFMKPVKKIFPSFKLIKKIYFRKQLGVLDTYLFLIHSIGMLLGLESFSISQFVGWDNHLLWGLLGGIIMVVLGVTSNTYSKIKLNKFANKGWKKLQRSAYLLFVFASLHAYIFSQEIIYLVTLVVYIILKVFEFSGFTVGVTESIP